MEIVTLDFETYYDQDYTLSKLATSEYVRDSRFEVLTCAVKVGSGDTKVYAGSDVAKALAAIDWSRTTLLAHHTHFDGLILSHHYGHVCAKYADTLSMARALHPKDKRNDLGSVAKRYNKQNKLKMPDTKGKHLKDLSKEELDALIEYNTVDVDICAAVYSDMVKNFPKEELDLISHTVRMFAEPVLVVDLETAQAELDREIAAKEKAIADSGCTIQELSSNPKFVRALETLGIDIPLKPSPTVAGKFIPAVAKSDEALTALLSHPDEKVVKLVEGRLAAKSTIGESRAARLIQYGTGMNLPIYLTYCGAHTMRWSGGDKLNPQNFKQSQKTGGVLRRCIMAPEGQVIVVVDSAQIEARITAWLCGQEDLLEDFRLKRDPYCAFASKAYGRPITKADKEERFVGKTCVLGLGYGMGGAKLQTTILAQSISQGLTPVRLPLDICYSLVAVYRQSNRNIANMWEWLNDTALKAMIQGEPLEFKGISFDGDVVQMPNGLNLMYPGLDGKVVKKRKSSFFSGLAEEEGVLDASYLTYMGRNKLYGGLFLENIVQCLARIFIGEKMNKIASSGYRIVMSTHDEIAFLTHALNGQTALDFAIAEMSTPPLWAPDLPVSAEGTFDRRYDK